MSKYRRPHKTSEIRPACHERRLICSMLHQSSSQNVDVHRASEQEKHYWNHRSLLYLQESREWSRFLAEDDGSSLSPRYVVLLFRRRWADMSRSRHFVLAVRAVAWLGNVSVIKHGRSTWPGARSISLTTIRILSEKRTSNSILLSGQKVAEAATLADFVCEHVDRVAAGSSWREIWQRVEFLLSLTRVLLIDAISHDLVLTWPKLRLSARPCELPSR